MASPDDGIVMDTAEDARTVFASFYEREFQPQYRRARLMVGSTSVAEDVVHEAFVAVWRRWETLTDPGPYLNRCVLNGARQRYRRRARQRDVVRRLRLRSSSDGDEPEVLSDALGAPPFNHRAAIVLRYYGGLGDDEIAEALGCPSGSVGPWIHRGLRQLRKALS